MVPVHSPGARSSPKLAEAAEAEDFPQDVREGVLEVPVGHDVDHGVEGGVEVADPEEDADHDVGAVAVVADGHRQVPGEEGEPADQEGAHHDAQSHEGFVLLPPGGVDPVALPQPWKRENGKERKLGGHVVSNINFDF